MATFKVIIINVLLICLLSSLTQCYDVIYAINCGGQRHTDVNGIKYKRDDNEAGVASDFGKGLTIARVHPQDQVLYQTERYHYRDFSYDVPIGSDGQYFVVLKFAEVYFQRSNEKVFDVILNNHHTVVNDLDIYDRVGRAVALDITVPFTIKEGQLIVNGETSDFDGTLIIEFAKDTRDNPKINAIVVAKGNHEEFPPLPPIEDMINEQQQQNKQETNGEWGDTTSTNRKFKRTSGPRVVDPYLSDESWFWPITIAVAIFLPVMFCLCRLR